jgi:hypothetical protein
MLMAGLTLDDIVLRLTNHPAGLAAMTGPGLI